MFEVLVQSLKLVGLRKLFETLYGCSDRRDFVLMMWPVPKHLNAEAIVPIYNFGCTEVIPHEIKAGNPSNIP